MIWFMAPDLPELSGGLKMIYRMAEALNDSGRPATVWHGSAGLEYDALAHHAPVHHGLRATLAPGDLLVMQEVGGPKWSFLAGDTPVVMLVQGHMFLFDNLDPDAPVQPGYPGWPQVAAAVATSAYTSETVRRMAGPDLPIHRVPVLIDGQLFHPSPKERLIAYMPRRRHRDLAAVRHLAQRSGRLGDWQFARVEHMTEPEVAEVLGRSAIFLSGAEHEGFGMPGAEAMAAGCYVIGFTGDGGREYMRDDVCGVVHDADIVTMADLLCAAVHKFDHDPAELRSRVARARERVLTSYNRDEFSGAVLGAFDEIAASGTATVPSRTTIPHYQTHAPREGLAYDAYRASRRVARRALERVASRRRTGNATSN